MLFIKDLNIQNEYEFKSYVYKYHNKYYITDFSTDVEWLSTIFVKNYTYILAKKEALHLLSMKHKIPSKYINIF
jgi:hypothetical protein